MELPKENLQSTRMQLEGCGQMTGEKEQDRNKRSINKIT